MIVEIVGEWKPAVKIRKKRKKKVTFVLNMEECVQESSGGINIKGTSMDRWEVEEAKEELSNDLVKTMLLSMESWRCLRCLERGYHGGEGLGVETWQKQQGHDGGEVSIEALAHNGNNSSMEMVVKANHKEDEWVLNVGSACHTSPMRSWFRNFKEVEGEVLIDGMSIFHVVGIGDISLQLCGGSIVILEDVRCIPQLKKNLISISALVASGFDVNIKRDSIKAHNDDMTLMEGYEVNGKYVLHGHVATWDAVENDPKDDVDSMESDMKLKTLSSAEEYIRASFNAEQERNLSCYEGRTAADFIFPYAESDQLKPVLMAFINCHWMKQEVEDDCKEGDGYYQQQMLQTSVWENLWHVTLFEEDTSSYISNMMNNYIFDPGGSFHLELTQRA